MTDAAMKDIILVTEIDAPLERVWNDMTATDRVPLWLGCLQYQKKLGHVFYMQQDAEKRSQGDLSGATHCEVLDLDAPNTFRFSWYVPGMPKTIVTLSLKQLDNSLTHVEFVHSGWDQFSGPEIRNIRDALAGGWKSFVLPNLKSLAETSTE